jgi:hypothetical protein
MSRGTLVRLVGRAEERDMANHEAEGGCGHRERDQRAWLLQRKTGTGNHFAIHPTTLDG